MYSLALGLIPRSFGMDLQGLICQGWSLLASFPGRVGGEKAFSPPSRPGNEARSAHDIGIVLMDNFWMVTGD